MKINSCNLLQKLLWIQFFACRSICEDLVNLFHVFGGLNSLLVNVRVCATTRLAGKWGPSGWVDEWEEKKHRVAVWVDVG